MEPNPPVRRHHQPQAGMKVTIESFLKLNSTTFSRNPLIDDQSLFIDHTNKALRPLKCPSDRVVELAAYNLNGSSEQWCKTLLEGRNVARLPLFTWEEFTEAFMMRFFHVNQKEKFVAKFERLG